MARKSTWKMICNNVAFHAGGRVAAMTDRELAAFVRGMRRAGPTQRNCYWVTYGIAPTIQELVKGEIEKRRKERKAGLRRAQNTRATSKLLEEIITQAQAAP